MSINDKTGELREGFTKVFTTGESKEKYLAGLYEVIEYLEKGVEPKGYGQNIIDNFFMEYKLFQHFSKAEKRK